MRGDRKRTLHMNLQKLSIIVFAGVFLLGSCRPEIKDDFNDVHFELTDQNGKVVEFPDDFKGAPVVMGFIYTNCPDVCSFITANLHKIYDEMEDPGQTRFVLVTFDPERDTPEVLKNYASSFDMDQSPFLFLTGEPDEIESMMKRMSVRTQVSYTKETETGDSLYFLNHSDKILLLNEQGQLVMEYGGSMTPANMVIEDLTSILQS
ncbi:MAG: SCO family protein [Balneolaceae bacterium]